MDEGVFFLDAVDEAKLTTRHAFEKALKTFVIDIGRERIRRVNLVITSRISGWRNREDQALLRTLIDLTEKQNYQDGRTEVLEDIQESSEKTTKVQPLRVVTMDVLSAEQVGLQAQHVVPEHADNFLVALDAHNAWSFARRPQDVERLATYWQQNKTFGDLTDLLEFDIQSRLRETEEDRQRDSDLTDDQLRKGAETLATAIIFGKTFSIRLENELTGRRVDNDVLPSKELPNWTSDQHRDLLSRPLFDPAAYGLARFHHRSIAEYLASCWLDRMLHRDFPVSDVISLFFVRSLGEEVLIPSRAAVTCWLACGDKLWNQRILTRLLESSPEAVLEFGDGKRLGRVAREKLLHAVVARAGVEGSDHLSASNDQLKRLAVNDIAPTVSALLLDPETPQEVLLILLRLVREGQMINCVPAVLHLASKPQSSSHVVAYAAAAIARAGKTEDKNQYISNLLARPQVDENIAYQVVRELFPDSLSAKSLVHLAAKTQPFERMTFPDFAETAARTIIEKSCDNDVEPLLSGFVALLNQRPGIIVDKTCFLVSSGHIWLTPVLRATVSRAFSLTTIDDKIASKIVEALMLIEMAEKFERPYQSQKVDLQEPSFAHPAIRRLFCWRKADQEKLQKPAAKVSIHHIFKYHTPVQWSEHDFSWMLKDLDKKYPIEHRTSALHFINDLWWYSGRPESVKAEVNRRVRKNRELKLLFRKEFPSLPNRWLSHTRNKIRQYSEW